MDASDNNLLNSTARVSLFHSDSVHEVHEEINRLDNLFRNSFNRAPESSMFIGTQWNTGRTIYSVSIHYQKKDTQELEFFNQNVRKTEINTN